MTSGGRLTASADRVTCDSSLDVVAKAFLRERHPDEGVKLFDVFVRIKGQMYACRCISMKQQIPHPAVTPHPLTPFDKDGSAFIVHVRIDSLRAGGNVLGCAQAGQGWLAVLLCRIETENGE